MLSAAHIRTFIGIYETETMPVIEYYSAQNKVAEVRATFLFYGRNLI